MPQFDSGAAEPIGRFSEGLLLRLLQFTIRTGFAVEPFPEASNAARPAASLGSTKRPESFSSVAIGNAGDPTRDIARMFNVSDSTISRLVL